MPRVIDYWRGLVADVKEADSNSAEHLRAVGDLWYPVLKMRILNAVHDGAERKLGPCDLPAAHAEQVAQRVWNDLVAAMHKRAVPEAWVSSAATIELLRPWLAQRLRVEPALVREAVAAIENARAERLADDAFAELWPEKLSSRDEQSVKGAITAYLFQDKAWPDLGTWVPFTLYSLTARYFEQGHYLGPKLCASETEILDLVEMAPFGREWALGVVARRAQTRTVASYTQVLTAILDRQPLSLNNSLVARRLTLVEWLSDPEARLARVVQVQGVEASEAAAYRAFNETDRSEALQVLRAAIGSGLYPVRMTEEQRRTMLERLVEAMENCAVRTEMLVHVTARGGKRGPEWAKAVLSARVPKTERDRQMALLNAIVSRKDARINLGPVQRNRSLRSMHRTLTVAARPDAGITLEAAHAAQGAG